MPKGKKKERKRSRRDDDEEDMDTSEESEEEVDLAKMSVEDMCRKYFPQITEIKKDMKSVLKRMDGQEEDMSHMKIEMTKLQDQVSSLQEENDRLQALVAQQNLMISGVPEEPDEDEAKLKQSITKIFKEIGVNVSLDQVTRMKSKPAPEQDQATGKKAPAPATSDQDQVAEKAKDPGLIRVRFMSMGGRDAAWNSRRSLKHPIYLSEDLPKRTRINRAVIRKKAREERKTGKEVKVSYKNLRITVDGVEQRAENGILVPVKAKIKST